MGWLVSLTLEDEVRHKLDLPWVVSEYEDVFSDELSGLLCTGMWTLSLSYTLVRHPFL